MVTRRTKLMHDFFCADPDDMHFGALANKARYYKHDEKGVGTMCKMLEDMRNEAAKEATWQKTVEDVQSLLEMGLSFEQVAQGLRLTVEQVKEIAGQRSA